MQSKRFDKDNDRPYPHSQLSTQEKFGLVVASAINVREEDFGQINYNILPAEIKLEIFSYLSMLTLGLFSQVSKEEKSLIHPLLFSPEKIIQAIATLPRYSIKPFLENYASQMEYRTILRRYLNDRETNPISDAELICLAMTIDNIRIIYSLDLFTVADNLKHKLPEKLYRSLILMSRVLRINELYEADRLEEVSMETASFNVDYGSKGTNGINIQPFSYINLSGVSIGKLMLPTLMNANFSNIRAENQSASLNLDISRHPWVLISPTSYHSPQAFKAELDQLHQMVSTLRPSLKNIFIRAIQTALRVNLVIYSRLFHENADTKLKQYFAFDQLPTNINLHLHHLLTVLVDHPLHTSRAEPPARPQIFQWIKKRSNYDDYSNAIQALKDEHMPRDIAHKP